ncbi:LysR substrate-binding domain-containing protein [Acuticoccus sp. I52.16.1]|nr:LysR substrate-binding domain-containing protein [Acuticoccus sp. I52.16.1]UOM32609.1 LysR substrate-binding domain-containing protein [Acuticoccus sp. I52.16.1]
MLHGVMKGGITLSMLRSFEAAARHSSFKSAADELGLSASAISHSVRELEGLLGVRLFRRSGRGVHATMEGIALFNRLAHAFDEIRRGIEDVGQLEPTVLRLHAAPSFALLWLMPRLSAFLEANPKVDVRLSADTDYARFAPDDFDLDIVYGPVRAEGVRAVPLGEETVTPVCAPDLAARIAAPADLLAFPLIQSEQKQVRWDDWLRANGLTQSGSRHLRFDRSFIALSAAERGMGVALESTRLAEEAIGTGRLVAPLAGNGRDIRYVGHSLVVPRAVPMGRATRTFATWLLGALGVVAGDVTRGDAPEFGAAGEAAQSLGSGRM